WRRRGAGMFSVGIPAISGGDERWFDADKKSGTHRAGFGFCASGAGSNGSWRMASRLGEPFLYDVVFMD
ncbi:hypothetical protein LCG94_01520, partial [Aeromonas salmonicida]|uniref:hypothetical protein n=1 Tax=Aeromonas salmonicida TaxID=645 RepID=UPI003BB7513A